jgi:hypothetical protein
MNWKMLLHFYSEYSFRSTDTNSLDILKGFINYELSLLENQSVSFRGQSFFSRIRMLAVTEHPVEYIHEFKYLWDTYTDSYYRVSS